jgi:outer membrane protein assembly factor BamB
MAPAFVYGSIANTPNKQDTVVVGQKNGNLYALSAVDGATFWATVTSPDGLEGGLIWGVAVDDVAVYFTGKILKCTCFIRRVQQLTRNTAVNYNAVSFQLQPSNITVNNSAYGAASLSNGTLLWETAAPNNSISFSPPSVVNDVVVVGLTGQNYAGQGAADYEYTNGSLIIMNKANGSILVNYMLDTNTHGGIAVYGEYLIFGTGYFPYNGTGSLYVLEVDTRAWARMYG